MSTPSADVVCRPEESVREAAVRRFGPAVVVRLHPVTFPATQYLGTVRVTADTQAFSVFAAE